MVQVRPDCAETVTAEKTKTDTISRQLHNDECMATPPQRYQHGLKSDRLDIFYYQLITDYFNTPS